MFQTVPPSTVINAPVMSNIIYIFQRKTLLQGMAIFSEKSHQQGHDPSLNPLFSATRSLNAREQNHAAAPPPLPSQQRIHTLLFAKCSNDSLSPRGACSTPCESDLIALSGQWKLTGYLLVNTPAHSQIAGSQSAMKWNGGTGVRVNWPWQWEESSKKRARQPAYWQPAFDTVISLQIYCLSLFCLPL